MRAVIVFHSVCGNVYLVARSFERELAALGHSVVLRRVADADWVAKPEVPAEAGQVLQAMRAVPEVVMSDLDTADLVIMGCPVYFGNVTAEMKAFMDATGGQWFCAAWAGRKFAAFTSAGGPEGGGDLCLQALRTYAAYMGMLTVPLPNALVKGGSANALGVIQYSQGRYALRPDPSLEQVIKAWCQFMSRC